MAQSRRQPDDWREAGLAADAERRTVGVRVLSEMVESVQLNQPRVPDSPHITNENDFLTGPLLINKPFVVF